MNDSVDQSNKMQKASITRQEYAARINRVIDYIEAHLSDELSLEALAGVANFSRFHFHRIFHSLVGETLNQFIQRIRVEKAAALLAGNPKKSITEIALDTGFSGSAAFARSFKDTFGMSASQWREQKQFVGSKICKTNGNERKAFDLSSFYISASSPNPNWRMEMKDKLTAHIEVKEMPEMHVAYIRHIGPYAGQEDLFKNLFTKLMMWAGPRGLLRFPETQCLSVYHDDPSLTDESKLRTSMCITVPVDTPVDGEIGKMVVPGGKFAVAHFEIQPTQYGEAWDALCGNWLPESGYQPDDRLVYELYLNDPKTHPEGKHIVDICLPVKPL